MDPIKPLWLTYAVDYAQILSAFSTTAAVITALWLSKRNESQRLKLTVNYFSKILISAPPPVYSKEIRCSIVNTGLLPAMINFATLGAFIKGKRKQKRFLISGFSMKLVLDPAPAGANTLAGAIFPMELKHGEQVSFRVIVDLSDSRWQGIDPKLWNSWRPQFAVSTSLGKIFEKRLSIRDTRQISNELINMKP